MSRISKKSKNPEDSNAWSKEANGKKPREWALELLKSRQESDVLKRSSETLREASIETLDPDGQRDSTPTIGPEPTQAKKKEKSSKEVLLVTAENIESMNFRFTAETVSRKIIILHMFTLKCHYGDCTDQFCGEHGTFRALSPECHKDLEMEDMFMPFIEQLCPINFLCSKCLASSGLGENLIGRKSSLKHIREDMRVNEIIVCEPRLMERIALRLKSEEEVQVV